MDKLAPGVHTEVVNLGVRLIIPSAEEITKLVVVNFFEQYIHDKSVALKYCNHSKKKKCIENHLKKAQLAYQQWREENVCDSN